MKQDIASYADREVELIYIARRLADATKVESILTAGDVDYAVEPDEYQGGVVFRRTRIGAFFYVLPEFRERAVSLIEAAGYKPQALE